MAGWMAELKADWWAKWKAAQMAERMVSGTVAPKDDLTAARWVASWGALRVVQWVNRWAGTLAGTMGP
jgi:hypothetical protein